MEHSSKISWKDLFSISKIGLNVSMITFHAKSKDVADNTLIIG
jgi:hypothetical protein